MTKFAYFIAQVTPKVTFSCDFSFFFIIKYEMCLSLGLRRAHYAAHFVCEHLKSWVISLSCNKRTNQTFLYHHPHGLFTLHEPVNCDEFTWFEGIMELMMHSGFTRKVWIRSLWLQFKLWKKTTDQTPSTRKNLK